MAGTVGRPNPTYGWNAYDWVQKLRYTITAFTALTFTSQTPTTANTSVTIAGPSAAGSKLGLLYGLDVAGYDRKTRLVPGPGPVALTLRELEPNTVYHVAAYGIGGDGVGWVGPDTLLTTPP